MKLVMHVITGLGTGGAELMLKRLIECRRDKSEYSHMVISLTGFGTVGRQLKSQGVEVIALEMASLAGALPALFKLTRLIRRYRPTVVQTWMYHADLIGGLAARLAGARNVAWGIRTTSVRAGGKVTTALVRKACALLSGWVPKTIICAADASRVAHAAAGYESGRMRVIPNGFDFSKLTATVDERSAIRREVGADAAHLIVGCLGRFHPAKDHRNFVVAAGKVARKISAAKFLMVGRGLDRANEELMGWIRETGFSERFVLLGEREDVAQCLAAMDVFCLPSKTEGFPNVLGEAMAMALPCVSTDVGDAKFLLGGTGLIVGAENPEELAEALVSCMRLTPVERTTMGQLAQRRVHGEFSICRAKERFEAVYAQIAGPATAGGDGGVKGQRC